MPNKITKGSIWYGINDGWMISVIDVTDTQVTLFWYDIDTVSVEYFLDNYYQK